MKVLIIKLGALGDIVMSTALILQIQKHHAGDDIFLLTSPNFISLFNAWDNLTVHAFPRKGIFAMINTLCWIRRQSFSRLYDLQSNDRSAIFTAFSGSADRIVNHPRYPYNIHPEDTYTGQCHVVERMKQILKSAGLAPPSENPCLPITNHSKEKVKSWIKRQELQGKPFIVMHAGASLMRPEKRWPHFEELGAKLDSAGYRIIWIGAEADIQLNKKLSNTSGIDATNVFSLPELAELGKHAQFAITNDSGPMHVLSCSNIPVYAFFGPTNWRRTHALGQEQRVIVYNGECLACIGKPTAGEHTCLSAIKVDDVIKRLKTDELVQ